jgi:hypothetical protein
MGSSNLTSIFNNGISILCLWTCFFKMLLELEVKEEGEEGGEGGI